MHIFINPDNEIWRRALPYRSIWFARPGVLLLSVEIECDGTARPGILEALHLSRPTISWRRRAVGEGGEVAAVVGGSCFCQPSVRRECETGGCQKLGDIYIYMKVEYK